MRDVEYLDAIRSLFLLVCWIIMVASVLGIVVGTLRDPLIVPRVFYKCYLRLRAAIKEVFEES